MASDVSQATQVLNRCQISVAALTKSPAESFELFPKLPKELQYLIWELSCQEGRFCCVFVKTINHSSSLIQPRQFLSHNSSLPPILGVCQSARAQATRRFCFREIVLDEGMDEYPNSTCRIYLNVKRDVLCLSQDAKQFLHPASMSSIDNEYRLERRFEGLAIVENFLDMSFGFDSANMRWIKKLTADGKLKRSEPANEHSQSYLHNETISCGESSKLLTAPGQLPWFGKLHVYKGASVKQTVPTVGFEIGSTEFFHTVHPIRQYVGSYGWLSLYADSCLIMQKEERDTTSSTTNFEEAFPPHLDIFQSKTSLMFASNLQTKDLYFEFLHRLLAYNGYGVFNDYPETTCPKFPHQHDMLLTTYLQRVTPWDLQDLTQQSGSDSYTRYHLVRRLVSGQI